MGKYAPLRKFLSSCDPMAPRELAFAEIEELIGCRLPNSARRHRAWWSNARGGHAQAEAWLRGGWQTSEVDLDGERAIFTFAHEPARCTCCRPVGSSSLSIEQAKAALAATFGVSAQQIEITVRG